jgi:ATP-dependent Clp protease adaptor protein ClpS
VASATIAEPEARERTELAPLYRVLCHDDDVTTMDFVVEVLRGVFRKAQPEALRLMLEVHHTGVALIEVVPLEVAELHVDQAHSLARARRFPLTFTIEPE